MFKTISLAFTLLFLTSAQVGNETPRIMFKDFRTYDLEKMQASELMKQYDGKTIQVIGFMMPFESIENIEKFMLLQAPFMGCFHLPPPQADETIMVFSEGLKVNYDQFPQLIEGTLKIEETNIEGYLVSVYTLEASSVKRADYKDLEMNGIPPGAHMQSDF